MRPSIALVGLLVVLALFLTYYLFSPALTANSLPIHLPTFQIGTEKGYSPYAESPHRPLHLVVNEDASHLFIARGGGAIEEWELASRTQVATFRTNDIFSYVSPINSLITKNIDDNVEVLQLESKKLVPLARDFYIHNAIDHSGTKLVLSTGSKSLEMWKVDSKTLFKTWETHKPVRNGVAISSDGQFLAAAEGTYEPIANFHHTAIQIWDLKEKADRLLFDGEVEQETHGVWNIVFSPDASMIAVDSRVAGKSGVTVWDTKTGERIFEVRGLDSYWVRALAFSPSGNYLASGDELGNLTIWSLDIRKQVWQGQVGGQVVHSIAFSPDGHTLLAGIQDSTIQVWDIDVGSDEFLDL